MAEEKKETENQSETVAPSAPSSESESPQPKESSPARKEESAEPGKVGDTTLTPTPEPATTTESGTEPEPEPEPKANPSSALQPGPSAQQASDESSKSDDQENEERLESEFAESAAVATFDVLAIDSNGAHEESKVGYTLRLVPVDTEASKKFFKFSSPELHIGVVTPEVASKFKVGSRVSLILLNED